MRRVHASLCSLLVLIFAGAGAGAAEWPHLRGPSQDGRVAGGGLLSGEGTGLAVAWRRPVGSAYSGIAVAGGLAVTMGADGDSDFVVAFDAETGEPRWKAVLGATYAGHDGSDDGPLSSPVIDGETVFALSAQGTLVALRLADGAEIWKRSIKETTGAEEPFYGFTTTPIVVGNVLVVQAGGKDGNFLVGLNRKTGKKIWGAGDAKVDYQSPTLMTLGGRRQVVAGAEQAIYGVDPADGTVLWRHALPEETLASMHPVPLGDDAFLGFIGGEAIRFELGEEGLKETFRSQELGNTFAAPVHHEGYLYGFRRAFLTCIDATSGERVWKSRPPGGRGLILVDDKLVVYGAEGIVVVADATPEGYRERARVQALTRSGYAWPSFADGRIFVRSHDEIAGLKTIAAAERAAGDGGGEIGDDHLVGRFLKRLETTGDKKAAIDAFFTEHPRFPIVERDLVHFLYRGKADDVAVSGSMLAWDVQESMERVEGTDLYHRTLRVDPGARVQYRFQIDYETWARDPRNPRSAPAVRGDDEMSVVDTGGKAAPTHLADAERSERGRLDELTLASEIFDEEREVKVYLPPGYEASKARYPLLIVSDGPAWLEKGRMLQTLDNLIGKRIAPVIAVFVPRHEEWWLEAGGSRTDDYVKMLADELVPLIDERFRTVKRSSARALMGTVGYALSSAVGVLQRPDRFGKAALQSVSLDEDAGPRLLALLDEENRPEIDWYVDWSRYESRSVDRGYDLRDDGRRLAELLEAKGYRITGGESLDGHGWDGWRSKTDRLLEALFPRQ